MRTDPIDISILKAKKSFELFFGMIDANSGGRRAKNGGITKRRWFI
jgi:hypothetical protein